MRSFDNPVSSAYEQHSFMDTFYLEGKLIVQISTSAAEMINWLVNLTATFWWSDVVSVIVRAKTTLNFHSSSLEFAAFTYRVWWQT